MGGVSLQKQSGDELLTAASVQRQQPKTTRNRSSQEHVTAPGSPIALTLTDPQDLPPRELKVVMQKATPVSHKKAQRKTVQQDQENST